MYYIFYFPDKITNDHLNEMCDRNEKDAYIDLVTVQWIFSGQRRTAQKTDVTACFKRKYFKLQLKLKIRPHRNSFYFLPVDNELAFLLEGGEELDEWVEFDVAELIDSRLSLELYWGSAGAAAGIQNFQKCQNSSCFFFFCTVWLRRLS